MSDQPQKSWITEQSSTIDRKAYKSLVENADTLLNEICGMSFDVDAPKYCSDPTAFKFGGKFGQQIAALRDDQDFLKAEIASESAKSDGNVNMSRDLQRYLKGMVRLGQAFSDNIDTEKFDAWAKVEGEDQRGNYSDNVLLKLAKITSLKNGIQTQLDGLSPPSASPTV